MRTIKILLSICILLRITISNQNFTTSLTNTSLTAGISSSQIFSNTSSISSTIKQNISVTNETMMTILINMTTPNVTMSPHPINNMTTPNVTISPHPMNNLTTPNVTMPPHPMNNMTTLNVTMPPHSMNNMTTPNITMPPHPMNNMTTLNVTMPPHPINNMTTLNVTMPPHPMNNMTTLNGTMITNPMNNITTVNVTNPMNNMTAANETMTINGTEMSTVTETTVTLATVIYDLPEDKDEPARPGEYSSKVRMRCSFKSEKFHPSYKSKASKEYKEFTRSIFFRMRWYLRKLLRLIEIIFLSLEEGSVIANMEFVLASNTSVSSTNLSNIVQAAAVSAYGNTISVTNVNTTEGSVTVPSTNGTLTTTSMNNMTTGNETMTTNGTETSTVTESTVTLPTIIYDLNEDKDEPARSGEYSSKVKMGCSFKSEKFHQNYKIKTSKEYKEYTRSIFFRMRWNLRKLLRLIEIIFLSLEEGSVVATMEFVLASNTSVPSTNLSNIVQAAAVSAYGNTISVTSVNTTEASFPVVLTTTSPPSPTTNPSIPGWGIFLIILAIVIVVIAIILLSIYLVKYQRSHSSNLDSYLDEDSSNDRHGIILKTRSYDSF